MSKYKQKKKTEKVWLTKILLCIIIVLSSLIYVNFSSNNKEKFEKYILNKNISFVTFRNLYEKYIGKIDIKKDNEEEVLVFKENLSDMPREKVDSYYKFKVGKNYAVSAVQSGIIVFIGEKDNLGKTVIIQGIDGVDIWYSNISLNNYSLYDYVSDGDIIANTDSDYLFMTLMKDGNYLTYEEYFS